MRALITFIRNKLSNARHGWLLMRKRQQYAAELYQVNAPFMSWQQCWEEAEFWVDYVDNYTPHGYRR